MKKLKIIRLGWVYGWAFHFITQNQQKYSKHEIIYKIKTDSILKQIKKTNPDIIYFHCPDRGELINSVIKDLPDNIKIMGGYSGEVKDTYLNAHLIVSLSYPFLSTIKSLYPNKEVIFLPEGVDETFFAPRIDPRNDDFTVGWAGRPHLVKRFYLLGGLKYPIKVMMNYGTEYFKKSRTLLPMKDFYHSLDVFVLPSKSETSSGVTMEAMACGLPVVATDVGNIKMLLAPEWIVPNTNDEEITKGINYRLDLLKENSTLRKEVGERNRKQIEKYFTWKQNQLIWDEVYSALIEEDYAKIKQLSESYLESFKKEN